MYLQDEIGGLKTKEQMGHIVLQIVRTVINSMGSTGGRRWTTQDDESLAAKAGIGNEQTALEKLMAVDPREAYPEEFPSRRIAE